MASNRTSCADCPAVGHLGQRNGARSKHQRGNHHHQAHRLVQDDGLKAVKAKQADEQRQPEFRAAKADQSAERSDAGTRPEDHQSVARFHEQQARWEARLSASVGVRPRPDVPVCCTVGLRRTVGLTFRVAGAGPFASAQG